MYDENNVFAKILKKLLPCDIVYEDEILCSFKDAYPVAKIHVIVIPKKTYIDYDDFILNAQESEISHFFKTISKITKQLNLEGYRLITNKGKLANQTVMHFHMHILSGEQLKGF